MTTQFPIHRTTANFSPQHLRYGGPVGNDTEHVYFLDPWGVPFQLQFVPEPSHWETCDESPDAYIYGPEIDNSPNGDGLEYTVVYRKLFLRATLRNWQNLPTDVEGRARAVIAEMQSLLEVRPLRLKNGTVEQLASLMQDLSSWCEAEISVETARSEKAAHGPDISMPGYRHRISQRFIRTLVEWFWPIGDRADLSARWLNKREPFWLPRFEPKPLTGHERIEVASRLTGFITDNAEALGLNPAQLKNVLKAFQLR